jgi:hypothetical protein
LKLAWSIKKPLEQSSGFFDFDIGGASSTSPKSKSAIKSKLPSFELWCWIARSSRMHASISLPRGVAFLAGCLILWGYSIHGGEGSPSVPSATNAPHQATSPQFIKQSGSNDDDRAALDAGLKMAAKMREDRIRGVPQPPSQFPFPNYDCGPGRPYPVHVNLYGIDDHYPDYLQC